MSRKVRGVLWVVPVFFISLCLIAGMLVFMNVFFRHSHEVLSLMQRLHLHIENPGQFNGTSRYSPLFVISKRIIILSPSSITCLYLSVKASSTRHPVIRTRLKSALYLSSWIENMTLSRTCPGT